MTIGITGRQSPRHTAAAPTLSVAVVNHNYGRYLAECLNSVLDQDGAPDQVVVVDDGSTDDSRAVLDDYGDRVEVVLQENTGQTRATNTAFQQCTGDIVALLDSDDLALKGRWTALRDVYAAQPDVQWCFHDVQHVDRSTGRALSSTPRQVGFDPGRHDHRRAVARGRLPITLPPTSGLSWRRSFLERLTPTPAPLLSQDNYLKLLSLGLGVGCVVGEPLAAQGIHGTNMYTMATGRDRATYQAVNAVQMVPGLRAHGLDVLADRLLAGAMITSAMGRGWSPEDASALRACLRSSGAGLVPAAGNALARIAVGRLRQLRSADHS
jgi:hypothetical protein